MSSTCCSPLSTLSPMLYTSFDISWHEKACKYRHRYVSEHVDQYACTMTNVAETINSMVIKPSGNFGSMIENIQILIIETVPINVDLKSGSGDCCGAFLTDESGALQESRWKPIEAFLHLFSV